MIKKEKPGLPVIGWREWVGLPELGIKTIKVKVDTGARSSSLHIVDLKTFDRDGVQWVRFKVHPLQRSNDKTVDVEAVILEFRSVRSSSGVAKMRPVIVTNIELLGTSWPVELTLASRDEMGRCCSVGRRFEVDFLLMVEGRITVVELKLRNRKKDSTLLNLTPVNGEISQDKCLGGNFKFIVSIQSSDFLFFDRKSGVRH